MVEVHQMKLLFATEDYFPERGGLQESTHKLIHWLLSRGHDCEVLVRAKRRDLVRPKTLVQGLAWKFFNRPFLMRDHGFPYPLYRTKTPAESLAVITRRFKPDVLVCVVGGNHTIDFAHMLANNAADLPVVIYIFDVQGVDIVSDPVFSASHIIANAEVIAALIADHRPHLQPPVIPCIVDATNCMVESTRQTVLYINPHPRKGVDLAWAIAEATPEVAFVFQESWKLSEREHLEIQRRAHALGNVEFRLVTNRPADIYKDAKILLAPYGPERPRVIDEAQANGIPVVASDVPGLRENVGSGGVLVDPEGPIAAWTMALERLASDGAYYEKKSHAALLHSQRAEIQPEYLVERFELAMQNAIDSITGNISEKNGKINAFKKRSNG